MEYVFIGIVMGAIGIALAAAFYFKVMKAPEGTERMREISSYIREGAKTFLRREYKTIAIYAAVVAVILYLVGRFFAAHGLDSRSAYTFLFGGFLSALAGYIGMTAATKSNARAAEAVKEAVHKGLRVAFMGGSVMGLMIASLGLLGVTITYLIFYNNTLKLSAILFGFSFGASSIALFARVGGGIYTKAADVGADIVGKVEEGIPEDDPRNPAVIADNVGDNVGDVAGMGADLYESYVDSLIATIVLGVVMGARPYANFVILVASAGLASSIVGIFATLARRSADPFKALNTGTVTTTILLLISTFFIAYKYLPVVKVHDPVAMSLVTLSYWRVYVALLLGIIVGVIIGFSTQYYTSDKYSPTKHIAEACTTGAATNILAGMSIGMMSTAIPVIAVVFSMLISFKLSGIYGISLAAVGMLSTLAMTMSMDAYGPIADNAAGISEMAELGEDVRARAEMLDAVGNTTAAIGKGFAIGSAALTALAFFANYSRYVAHVSLSVENPTVCAGIFIGALMPFFFCSLTIRAVEKAAMQMVNEVRRQFRERPGILEWKEKPDYSRCVDIAARAALRHMVLPALLAIITPIIVGMIPGLGARAVSGVIVGAIASGFLLAIYMANAGGAWDNAKKYIEAGNFGGKGSEAHKAGVIGDTVGDPLKDTAGPSLNILIKLMSIVSLLFAPLFFL